ncbi:EAL domain-containing protein [Paraglaciecola aestuariivivens]
MPELVWAKSRHFQPISTESDLPSPFVNHIEVLNNGFLLFSTKSGARLYDGYQFIPVLSESSAQFSVLNTTVYITKQDSAGHIWFGTTSGLFRLDPNTSKLKRFAHDPNDPTTLVNDSVKRIFEDSQGYIWFGTTNGLSRYDPREDSFSEFTPKNDLALTNSAFDIRFILEDGQQRIWFGGSHGSYFYDYAEKHTYQPEANIFKQYTTSGIISGINQQSATNTLWLASFRNGLYQIDLSHEQFAYKHYQTAAQSQNSLSSNSVWRLFEDEQGLIWIGHWDSGLNILDPKTGKIETYNHNPSELSGLPSNAISAITQDKSGLIWLATANGAVSYNSNALEITHLTSQKTRALSLLTNEVWSILEQNEQQVWIGTSKGLNGWNTTNQKIESFIHLADNPQSISAGSVWAIKPLNNTELLIATDSGLNKFNKINETFTQIAQTGQSEFEHQPIYALHSIAEGQFLAGGKSGNIYHFNAQTNKLTPFIIRQNHPELHNLEYINTIKSDAKNNIWFGTTTGLYRYDQKSQKIMTFNTDSSMYKLNANNIESLVIDTKNQVWVATRGAGIQKITPTNKDLNAFNITSITTKQGLPENSVTNLILDKNDSLWFTTRRFIGQVNNITNQITTLPTQKHYRFGFTPGAAYVGQSGQFYLGGEGLYRFSPNSLTSSTFAPSIVITGVTSMHRDYANFSPLAVNPNIELTAQDTLVTFSYSALDYRFPNFNRYRYKLEGVDNHWLEPKAEHQATYSHLPFGEFLLRVQGTNGHGVWSTQEAQLKVKVIAPWWRTNLAYSLYAISILSFILGLVVYFTGKRAQERKRNKAIKLSESRLKSTLWASGDELWHWDLKQGLILRTNLIFALANTPNPEKLNQKDFYTILHPEDKSILENSISKHLQGESKHFECECRLLIQNIGYQWVLMRGRIIKKDKINQPLIIAGTVRDIAELKKKEDALTSMANYDQLTGLPNRHLFKEQLDHAISQAKRFDESVALLFLDLDAFKLINDTHGHAVGDELLIQVAERLTESARKSDNVARLGGDEFTVILERVTNQNTIILFLERLLQDINLPYKLSEHTVNTAVSVGVAVFPDDGQDAQELLKSSDIAMYEAKKAGKATFRFFTEKMNTQILQRVELEAELRSAVKNNEFELHYQPKVSVKTSEILGVEALIRWQHPSKGFIRPDLFIPIAEEIGLINLIGQFVLNQACSQCAKWREKGWLGVMAVNASAKEVQNLQYIESIDEVLNRYQLPAHSLEIEVTEGVFIANLQHTQALLQKIRDKGVRLALDDFGTGYSSLAYLKNLPIDTLKIDRSFIAEIEAGQRTYHLVKAIVQMAHSLNLEVVAEGIETQKQLNVLKEFGCQEYQGFYFAKPMSASEIERLIFNSN